VHGPRLFPQLGLAFDPHGPYTGMAQQSKSHHPDGSTTYNYDFTVL
jgi:hypothetical protein